VLQAIRRLLTCPECFRLEREFAGPDFHPGEQCTLPRHTHTNVVERAIRPGTITRKNSLFAGSDAGARRWAIANTLIQTCKLNSIDPLAWLTDVLQRIVSGQTKNQGLHALLPWNWHSRSTAVTA
jgi:transposase IS66-like protein/transposase IS66 family protein